MVNAVEQSPKPALSDYVSLWLLRLAKLRRKSFATDDSQYTEFYEDYFQKQDVQQYEEDRRMSLRRETIAKYLKQFAPANARILDCGCGLGDVLSGIPADPGYELHGFDFAQSNVNVAQRRLSNGATIRQGSLYEIPFPDASFDVAMCTEVLEHIEDDRKAVSEISRIVKPGGFLLTAVPYQYYWPDYLRLMGHFRHYTRQSFSALLSDFGLTPEHFLPNHPNWHLKYTRKYVLVRIEALFFGRFVGRRSAYDFKWPWSSKRSIQRAVEKLQPLEKSDERLDYPNLPTSTFILARKRN
jgi:ubiquinone/menaquinone biosynthesis C-methylase UbiE